MNLDANDCAHESESASSCSRTRTADSPAPRAASELHALLTSGSDLAEDCRSQLNRNSNAKAATSNTGSRKVAFNTVTVFYFERSQGFSCVPSQGGSTLGMANAHAYRRVFTVSEYRREKLREHYEALRRHHETGRVRLTPEVLQRVERVLHKLKRAALRRRARSLSHSSADDETDKLACQYLRLASRKRSLSSASLLNRHSNEHDESDDDRACSKRAALAPLTTDDTTQSAQHSQGLEELDELASPNDSTRCHANSDSEDDNPSSASATPSGSDDDADTDAYLCGPQPVSAKQRRTLLRASGINHIDAKERDECNTIRLSREQCGCRCQVFCEPATCECAREAIRCQVDRVKFPCGCTRDGCRNPHGRVEFNPLRVRAHFLHTVVRLRREAGAHQLAKRSSSDQSDCDTDCSDYSNASDCQSNASERSDTDNDNDSETAEEHRFNSTESGSCRDCLQQQVGHPPSCNDVLLRFTRSGSGSDSQAQPHAVHVHQHAFVHHVTPTATLTPTMFTPTAYSYAHAAMNGVTHQTMPNGPVNHQHHHFASPTNYVTASPTLAVQQFANNPVHTFASSDNAAHDRFDDVADSDDDDDSDDEHSTTTDDETVSEVDTGESESACVDELQSDADDDDDLPGNCHNSIVCTKQVQSSNVTESLDSNQRYSDKSQSDLNEKQDEKQAVEQFAEQQMHDLGNVTKRAYNSSRGTFEAHKTNSALASPPPSPIFVSLGETSSILASAMMLPFSLDDAQSGKEEKSNNNVNNSSTDASTPTDSAIAADSGSQTPPTPTPTATDSQMMNGRLMPFTVHSSSSQTDYFTAYYHAATSTNSSNCCSPSSSAAAGTTLQSHSFSLYSVPLLHNAMRKVNSPTASYVNASANMNEPLNNDAHVYVDYSTPVSRWPAIALDAYGRSTSTFAAPVTYAVTDKSSQVNNSQYQSAYSQRPHSVCMNEPAAMMNLPANATNSVSQTCNDTQSLCAGTFESGLHRHCLNESASEDCATGANADCSNSPIAVDTPSTLNESSDSTSTSSTMTFGEIIKESIVVDTVSAYG